MKIDDVKRPEKVTPSATARPIIVTNHPTMATDPMMAPDLSERKADVSAEVLSHTAKTIAPLDSSLQPSEGNAHAGAPDVQAEEESDDPEPTRAATITSPYVAGAEAKRAVGAKADAHKPETSSAHTAEEAGDATVRDPEATQTAQEAIAAEAKVKREAELEAVITGGKYAVPINAVQRHRSRVNTIALCVLAALLAVALADAVADAGVVKPPTGVPHTHFFSKS